MPYINLTDDQLLLLDGKVAEDAQKEIDFIKKSRDHESLPPYLQKIITTSLNTGKLTWVRDSVRSCSYCDKKSGYETYPRSSRTHRKGEKNLSRPLTYSGLQFNTGFIHFTGMGDCCAECGKAWIEQLLAYIHENNLPIETPINSQWRRDPARACFECKEIIYESEMGRSPCMMGGGSFPSKCPKCAAQQLIFGKSHDVTSAFRMLPVSANA